MKILLAVDGSDASMSAVAATVALPTPRETTVEIISVVPDRFAPEGSVWPNVIPVDPPTDRDRVLDDVARRLLDIAERHPPTESAPSEPRVLEGRPATEIVAEAARFGARSRRPRCPRPERRRAPVASGPSPLRSLITPRAPFLSREPRASIACCSRPTARPSASAPPGSSPTCGLFDEPPGSGVVSVVDPDLAVVDRHRAADGRDDRCDILRRTRSDAPAEHRARMVIGPAAGGFVGDTSTTIARTCCQRDARVGDPLLCRRTWRADMMAVGRAEHGHRDRRLARQRLTLLAPPSRSDVRARIVRPTVASRSTSQNEEPVAAAMYVTRGGTS